MKNYWISRRRHRDFIAARRAKVLDYLDKLLDLDMLLFLKSCGDIPDDGVSILLDSFTKKEAE